MGQYLPILALMILAVLFAGISFVASRILNPPRPTPAKVAPYECGIVDQTDPPERFPVRFFLIAMMFIVFDIELIFFYPFAMVYGSLGSYGLVAILVFSAAVFESFVYLISKGALDWGPAKVRHRSAFMVDATRTARSTVRRVGLEGRTAGEPTVPPDRDPNREVAA